MPELPEVETTVRGISPHIARQMITGVIIRQASLRWPISVDIKERLIGKTVLSVERLGKYVLLKVATGTLLIHLGMSGHLRVQSASVPAKKHDHVDILFGNNKMLRFNDTRRFGCVLWIEGEVSEHFLLKNLGVEPLTDAFTGQYLWRRAQGRKVAIKTLLMDSHIVTGIGNIYASEILFASGIHPATPANTLSLSRLNKLVSCTKLILNRAIEQGGTTLKDFFNSDGKPGYFSVYLQAYGRSGLPCITCQTPLTLMKIGQRSTVYCKKCQRK